MSEVKFISGEGKPRLILEMEIPSGVIERSEVSNPGIIHTSSRHRLRSGRTVRISNHSAEANGDRVVTIIDEYTFTIPVAITTAAVGGGWEALTQIYESTGTTTFDATHAYETGSPAFSFVKLKNRVKSYRVLGSFTYVTYGKIIAIASGILTIDEWSNGVPTNGQKFCVDGWIIDLPRCQEMTEIFTPDSLVHELYNGDEGSILDEEFYGYKYENVLDYSKYASTEMLLDLRRVLNRAPHDRMILVPRTDRKGLNYEVILRDPISISRHRLKDHKKPIFAFKGKRNVQFYATAEGMGYDCGSDMGFNGTSF
jgi:hypothetical protein